MAQALPRSRAELHRQPTELRGGGGPEAAARPALFRDRRSRAPDPAGARRFLFHACGPSQAPGPVPPSFRFAARPPEGLMPRTTKGKRGPCVARFLFNRPPRGRLLVPWFLMGATSRPVPRPPDEAGHPPYGGNDRDFLKPGCKGAREALGNSFGSRKFGRSTRSSVLLVRKPADRPRSNP